MDYRNIRKSKGWIYNTLMPLVHLEYRLLFRKIYVHNLEGVPANKPVLIASNHPTAFIDPIFCVIFLDPPVYNMTRGDIFRKPFFRKLLEHCNMFPVYRQRDGYDKRERNNEVFEFCQHKLLDGVAVNILVEGEHHLDKRVLPIQKGIARVAFDTYENHPMDNLQIVPVGCNYIAGDVFRDEAKMLVGQPIYVKDYWERYQANPGETINTLCSDIWNGLLSICYHIEDRADDGLAEQLLTLWRNEHPDSMIPIVTQSAERFLGEKAVLERLNAMPADQKDLLRAETDHYFNTLEASGLSDEALTQPEKANWSWMTLFILGFIPYLFGKIMRWPIQYLADSVTNKKVSKREFRTSVLMGIGVLGTLVYNGSLLITGIILGWPLLVSLAILLPLFTWFSLFWQERWTNWKAARLALRHPERQRLLTMRSALHY